MKIGTHDGKFHTDEVCAIALLLRVYPDAEIVRTRDPKVLETCDILVDVGGVYDEGRHRFDHHQKGGAGEWPDGTKLSSFGLVWRSLRKKLIGLRAEVTDMIRNELVIPIDARDNGQQPERRARDIPSLADFIDNLNPAWNETGYGAEHVAFMEAVTFVDRYLERLIVRGTAKAEATEVVRHQIWKAKDSRLIILDQGLPWHDVVINEAPEALFVVLPGGSGEWLVQAIPSVLGQQQPLRRSLPKQWGGISGQQLVDVTGVADAKFSHNLGFIAVARSKEGALALAKIALQNDN